MKTTTGGLALAVILAAVVAQPAFSQRYTVLTYNTGLLRVLGKDMVPVVPARARIVARELAAFVAAATPDIILLEEAWKNSTASAIAKALTPLGYTSIRPRGCNPFCLGSGLLVLLREPLRVVDWDFAAFTKRPGLEVVSAKGVFTSVVEDPSAGGARFALVGTHMTALDTIDGEPKDKGQLDAFLSQAAQVVAALDSVSGGGTLPVILLGDFNVGPGYADAGYRAITGAAASPRRASSSFPAPRSSRGTLPIPLSAWGGIPWSQPPRSITSSFAPVRRARGRCAARAGCSTSPWKASLSPPRNPRRLSRRRCRIITGSSSRWKPGRGSGAPRPGPG